MRKEWLILTLLIGAFGSVWGQQSLVSIHGSITEHNTNDPVPFATVFCKEVARGGITNEQGKYELNNLPTGTYKLSFRCMGYRGLDTTIQVNTPIHLNVVMTPLNFQIEEVEVIAHESENLHSSSKIDKLGMEHLQPSSFTDLLSLLPGHTTVTPNLSEVNGISLRQVGNDYNTFLGTSFVINGSQLSNDANLQTFSNGKSDVKLLGRHIAGGGIDMREISTNDVESVEIIRGIAPVEYGDFPPRA
ncbi:MAG: TonB-dependent receptor [Bacteroidales bacterium]|nr:TonB-dependent receptor [Bacteroidales bacterium]